MPKKEVKISVRLTDDAAKKLNEAKSKGYSTSSYINELMLKSSIVDVGLGRKIMLHVNKMQSELEFEEDPEIKKNMREELHQICLALKSSQNPM